MELKPGYQQTEVGVIPVDWEVKAIRHIAEVSSGGTPRRENSDFWDGHIPWITTSEIDFYEIKEAQQYITQAGLENSAAKLFPPDTILMALYGQGKTRGKVAKLGIKAATNQACAAIVLKSNVISDFVFHALASRYKDIRELSNSGGQENLSGEIVKSLQIPFPSLPEQRAIAEALGDVDALLEESERLLAKKRDLKVAAMQQLLTGKTRLPGFDGKWEVKTLGSVAHIKTGSRNNEDKTDDGQYPFFVRSDVVERIESYSHDCEAILVPGEGRIGSIFHYINGRFDVHQRVYAITQFRPGTSAKFIFYYMAQSFGAYALQNTVKATVDSLRLPTFQAFEMLLPPTLPEQIAISEVLSEMDAEVSSLEARRDKTRDLKTALMQELLTGKTRLLAPSYV